MPVKKCEIFMIKYCSIIKIQSDIKIQFDYYENH